MEAAVRLISPQVTVCSTHNSPHWASCLFVPRCKPIAAKVTADYTVNSDRNNFIKYSPHR